MEERDINLLRLDIIAGLPYDEKLKAHALINRGADEAVLGYWYNLTHGCYSHLPDVIKQRDIEHLKLKYPEFSGDVDTWI